MGESSRTVGRLMMANENINPGEGACAFSRSLTDLIDLLEAMTVAGWVTSVQLDSRTAVGGASMRAVSGAGSLKEFR
ncbi:hypothetical protein ACWF99_00295 [Nocardia sp. NPDC055002]